MPGTSARQHQAHLMHYPIQSSIYELGTIFTPKESNYPTDTIKSQQYRDSLDYFIPGAWPSLGTKKAFSKYL